MAVDESIGALSAVATSNTPGGTDTVGPDLDDHLRDIKKNIRIAAETSQGPTAPTGFLGRQRLATSATASNTITWQVHDGNGFVSVMDVDTSGDNVSRWYARKGSMPGEAISGTLSAVSVMSSRFHGSASAVGSFSGSLSGGFEGSASGTFRGFFTGTASGVLKGQFLAENGSSSAPSMAFADDTDTGIYRSGAAVGVVAGAARQHKFRSDDSSRFPLGARFALTKTAIPENTATEVAKFRVLQDDVVAKVDLHMTTICNVTADDRRFGIVEYSFLAAKELGGMFFTAQGAASISRAGGPSPIPNDLTGALSSSTAIVLSLSISNNGTTTETVADMVFNVATNRPDDVSAEIT